MKMEVFNACMKVVLQYRSESRFLTDVIKRRLQAFVNGCMRYILNIWWSKKTTNTELWRITGQSDIDLEIRIRRFGRLGHNLRKGEISSTALAWNPQGNRKGGSRRLTGAGPHRKEYD